MTAQVSDMRYPRAAWIIAADYSRARMFCASTPTAPLRELEDLLNPTARLREHDLVSSRPGRIVKGRGGHTRAVGPQESHRQRAAEQFAGAVCNRLDQARLAGELDRLYLIAGPGFRGLLRAHMNPATQALIADEINKDVTKRGAAELRSLLPRQL